MKRLLLIAPIALAACSTTALEQATTDAVPDLPVHNHMLDVSRTVADHDFSDRGVLDEGFQREAVAFYGGRNNCSMWFGTDGPTESLERLKSMLLDRANREDPGADEYQERVDELLTGVYSNGLDTAALVMADLEVTEIYGRFALSILDGSINSYDNDGALYYVEQPDKNVLEHLANISGPESLDSLIHAYRPQLVEFELLQDAYRKWGERPDTSVHVFSCELLKWDSTMADSMNSALAKRLNQWGVRAAYANAGDDRLSKSLAEFQALRGLPDTGELDCETVEQLNMSKEEVLEKIALNLERLRALPRRLGDEYIIVNIPEFKLRIFKDGRKSYEMGVIVGDEYTPTPVFADTLSYLVFSPTWTVPQSIIQGEMIPALRKDPYRYINKNFKAYEGGDEVDQAKVDWSGDDIGSRYFSFLQQPGPSNALGLVKFIMPNDLSIYLHDTPTDYLFDRTERSMSHGCVRLEKPKELANYLLADEDDWDAEKIADAMKRDEPLNVDLEKKLPVEIVYLTTWVNEAGQLAILPDVYGHDARQKQMLSARTVNP